MKEYVKQAKRDYLIGMLFPAEAVERGLSVKCYSDFPLPTVSMGSHTYTTLTTNASGNFLASWRPKCFLTGSDSPNISTFTWNNNVALTGSTSTGGNFFVQGLSYIHNTSIQRYRLVSAELKISYIGSVLNQAGNVSACATFDPLVMGSSSSYQDSLVDRFGTFSLVENGLWSQRCPITADANGLSVLYLPMDPDDLFFEKQGSWYNATMGSGTVQSPDNEGAHINYVMIGQGLPASSTCVRVDIYSNYEVIVDPSANPMFKPKSSPISPEVHDAFTSGIKDHVGTLAVRRTDSNSTGESVWDSLAKLIPGISKVVQSILTVI